MDVMEYTNSIKQQDIRWDLGTQCVQTLVTPAEIDPLRYLDRETYDDQSAKHGM